MLGRLTLLRVVVVFVVVAAEHGPEAGSVHRVTALPGDVPVGVHENDGLSPVCRWRDQEVPLQVRRYARLRACRALRDKPGLRGAEREGNPVGVSCQLRGSVHSTQ